MEIRLYTWESCPEVYKNFGPYAKNSVSLRLYVTLVMVITENNDSRDFTPAEIKSILASFKNEPAGQLVAEVLGKIARVFFWINETQ